MLLERLDRQIDATIAAGGEIDPDEERQAFNAALSEPFKSVDGDNYELMRALGVA